MNNEMYKVDVYIFNDYEKTIELPFIPQIGMALREVSEKGSAVFGVHWDANTNAIKVYLKPYLSKLYAMEKPKTEIEHSMAFYDFFLKDSNLNDCEKETFESCLSQISKVNEIIFGTVKAREMTEWSQTMSDIELDIKKDNSYSKYIQNKNENKK